MNEKIPLEVVVAFAHQILITETCWLWTGFSAGNKQNPLPYGRFSAKGKQWATHRFSYELFVEPIPEGLVIDHVKERGCTSTLCVNPSHLEAVTQQINVLRGESLCAQRARQTHCLRGHPFNEENTYYYGYKGRQRSCRACRRKGGKS